MLTVSLSSSIQLLHRWWQLFLVSTLALELLEKKPQIFCSYELQRSNIISVASCLSRQCTCEYQHNVRVSSWWALIEILPGKMWSFFFLAVISKYEISSTVAQWLLLLLHSSDVCGDFHRKASIDDDRKKQDRLDEIKTDLFMILYCLSFILLYKLTTSCSFLYSARTRLNLSAVVSGWRIILKMYFSIYHQKI